MNTTAEETATTEKPKATKKARVGAQGAHVAPKKGKAAKAVPKAKAPKKAPKAALKAGSARDGSKAAQGPRSAETAEWSHACRNYEGN